MDTQPTAAGESLARIEELEDKVEKAGLMLRAIGEISQYSDDRPGERLERIRQLVTGERRPINFQNRNWEEEL